MFFFLSTDRWTIRIGDQKLDRDVTDGTWIELPVLDRAIHPKYDNLSFYFDVAILETAKLDFSNVSEGNLA
jgi:hypothetical protein